MTDIDKNDFGKAELLKDINPGVLGSIATLTAFDDKLLFRGNDGVNGTELWVSDGTEDGTRLLKDINPGSDSSFGGKGIPPRSFTIFDNKLFFSADDGDNGKSIWVSDGTEDGTQLFNEFSGYEFTPFNDKLFFSANGSQGVEPYVSDGSVEGTQLLKDINNSIGGNSFPSGFTVSNDKLFFTAEDETYRDAIWVSDGTENGTKLVKNINPDSLSLPLYITAFDDKVLFSAEDGTTGRELWISDGTEDGTQLLKDINPGKGRSSPLYFTEYKDKVYFNAFDGENGSSLWVTDGTTDGTQLFKQIGFPYQLTVFNDKLFFTASDGNGTELWVSDGTEEGTQLFKDINPGSGSSFSLPVIPVPKTFTVYNDKMFFSADDGTNGEQIWVTDGTQEGTIRVTDIDPERSVFNFENLTVADDKLFFTANKQNDVGEELWKLDLNSSTLVNQIDGTVNDDNLVGTPDNDRIFGDRGDDSVEYSGDLTDFTIQGSIDNFTVSGSGIGTDTLIDIEFLKFADGLIAVDDSLFV